MSRSTGRTYARPRYNWIPLCRMKVNVGNNLFDALGSALLAVPMPDSASI